MNLIDHDDEYITDLKYHFGDTVEFVQSYKSTISFRYDYISLNETDLCFNNPNISKDDLIDFFKRKKHLSKIIFDDIYGDNFEYHCHEVKCKGDNAYLKKYITDELNIDANTEWYKLPTLIQIAVYTDSKTQKAPRIVGVMANGAIFHPILFDLEHKIYKAK